MAASLLDGIDFDNLPSEIPPYIIKNLCIATQERYNIAAVRATGSFIGGFAPTRLAASKYFPYKSNTGILFELNDGDPVQDFSGEIETLLSYSCDFYADIEKYDDAVDTSSTSGGRFVLSDTADDSATYDNRLLEITGYEEYPDLSLYAPEEVKKWYDMLTTLKYVMQRGYSTGGGYLIHKGEFDYGTAPFYTTDQTAQGDDADYYGIDETSGTLEDPATTTPYSDMKTANSAWPATLNNTYDDSIETPNWGKTAFYAVRLRRDSGGDYISFLRAVVMTQVIDWASMRSTVGMVGKPVSYKYLTTVTIQESFPTGEDTNMSYPYSTTGDDEAFYCDLTVTEVSDKTEIQVDMGISPADLPANITDLANNEEVTVIVTRDSTESTFLELWDGDGGFDYYTPVP